MKPIATFTALLLLVCLAPCVASAQKIARECRNSECDLQFNGDIAASDAKTIEQEIRAAPAVVQTMTISSAGGDAFEALRVSAVLNKYFVLLMAGTRNTNGEPVQGLGGDCASACALVYITSNHRFGTEVFIHRPTFSVSSFRALSAEQAQAAYDSAADTLRAQLHKRGVADSLIEQIMSIPSDDLQKLGQPYPEYSAWMEEWLRSKCGSEKTAGLDALGHLSPNEDPSNAMLLGLGTVIRCEGDTIQAAAIHAQRR